MLTLSFWFCPPGWFYGRWLVVKLFLLLCCMQMTHDYVQIEHPVVNGLNRDVDLDQLFPPGINVRMNHVQLLVHTLNFTWNTSQNNLVLHLCCLVSSSHVRIYAALPLCRHPPACFCSIFAISNEPVPSFIPTSVTALLSPNSKKKKTAGTWTLFRIKK